MSRINQNPLLVPVQDRHVWVRLMDVLWGNFRVKILALKVSLNFPFRFLRYVRYEFLPEFRSFLGHIQTSRKKQIARYGVDLGQVWKMDSSGQFVLCMERQNRIHDMRLMYASRPWASLVDLDLWMEGWNMGAAYGYHHSGTVPQAPNALSSASFPFQDMRNSKGQTSCVTPAAIAGVTRKVE
jgi:hypothetical protein